MNVAANEPSDASLWLRKRDTHDHVDWISAIRLRQDEDRGRIRCPLCYWRPRRSSSWCCSRVDRPEGFLGGCGTVWNTFSTRGRCPGCQYRWRWTKCLRCAGWSRHEEWYSQPNESR